MPKYGDVGMGKDVKETAARKSTRRFNTPAITTMSDWKYWSAVNHI